LEKCLHLQEQKKKKKLYNGGITRNNREEGVLLEGGNKEKALKKGARCKRKKGRRGLKLVKNQKT